MKKLERLAWIEQTFGKDVVSPYVACYTLEEMYHALVYHWLNLGDSRPGIRTDTRWGSTQGYQLPFVFPVLHNDFAAAERLWNEHGSKLVYIVSGSVQPVLVQGVAERLDDEHVFFEVNDKEPMVTQRHMYDRPENLRQFVVGPSSRYLRDTRWFTCYKPEWCGVYSLDRIYAAMYQGQADELTFSIRMDRSVIIW